MNQDLRRRFFAEEIEAVAKLRTPALVDAFASVPREHFLPPGPWVVLADSDVGFGPARVRSTPDADPARVCHNIAVAIDETRTLFNGQPSTLGAWLDALDLKPGARVLHIGCGLGYYTALMAHCAGSTGRVVAFEADPALAASARANLRAMPWVEVRASADAVVNGETFDAMVVNAGVTHPLDGWLDALAIGGRMILPITSVMPAMGNIGKGVAVHVTRSSPDAYEARIAGVVAIYSAVGLRDDARNEAIGRALMAGPQKWTAVTRLRRDAHEPAASCWLHHGACCLSA